VSDERRPVSAPPSRRGIPKDGRWYVAAALIVLVVVLSLQYTTHRLILPRMRSALWMSVTGAFAGALVLMSGWGRGGNPRNRQNEIGTLDNSFYEPRRVAITESGAVLGGVAGALWWGASTWVVFFNGMSRGTSTNALVDFEAAVVVGALAGGVVGAALGLAAGFAWERHHRRQRGRPPA